ncbi:MAG: response regulator transcription factor [Bacteroidota bacterium]
MNPRPTIKLAIADDQKLFLKGLKFIVAEFDNIDLILEAENGKELLQKLETIRPDVILMDLKMPEMDGIEATEILKARDPDLKIILLTMYNEERLIAHMMKIGANGYLLKDEEPEVLREAIESVVERGFFFNEYVSKALVKGLRMKGRPELPSSGRGSEAKLTRREKEVLELICQEKTNGQIAQQLFLSQRTVEGHRRKLIEKTGVKNTAGLVIYAYRNGLVGML